MALQNTLRTEGVALVQTPIGNIQNGVQNVSFTAYVKVINITASKENALINVFFKGGDQQFSKTYNFVPSVADDAPNFIKQAYLHLKTLPEFSGATDC